MAHSDQNHPHGGASGEAVMRVFAFDHRMQFQQMPGADDQKIGAFKVLCLRAAENVSNGDTGYGILCDHRLGSRALELAASSGLWIGRPVEWPGSRPLTLEPEVGENFENLPQWPRNHVVKVLCFYHPDDDVAMKEVQEKVVCDLFHSARQSGLAFLLEVIPSKVGPVDEATTPKIIQRFYDIGVKPDWWKLEPFATDGAWLAVCKTITSNDPGVRGVVVLGLDAPADQLVVSFSLAAKHPLVKGFAVGRTIFGDAARAWMLGNLSDEAAIAMMQENYRALCNTWDQARELGKGETT